ncbi:Phosphatidylglycerol/phosphatidylinositol transfer protein [Curvularia kusanoi]|uniref:Phosphatidylglycerol/phosphatidylinositol transfer protein n=1 Tax=Curvularia kusanoi TaxID=90978 RepID=A0A9P4W8P5_CURKU|nr:Phosphatidylglycerol/phosphatidylinositol transfer protein [Curvularia kusanoi]
MQLTTLLLAGLGAASVSAVPSMGASWVPNQVTVKEEFKVPGDNPLYFCADPADYILQIEKVDLDPNPPKPGEKLSIKASGDFKEEVGEGSKMHLQVKYGLITLINQERDACDTIEQADLKCPLKKGELSLTKDVDLPREIPPGTYTVLADVYTEDGDKITCLTAKIAFHRNNDSNNDDAKPSGDGTVDGSGILSFNKVKVGKRKFEMSGPAAGLVQQKMQERLRQRNEL